MTELLSYLNAALKGRYIVDREIGRGGMASVYLASDIRHNRAVALKVLHEDLGAAIGAERFLREIQVVARLRHPQIVPLYDSGEADGKLYYVMPYVKGESVRQRIARAGAFPNDEALRLVLEVAEALEYAHGEGVVHRDIKPDNIMIDERHALVMDFGIARVMTAINDPSLTGTGLLIGTPTYMSPEQVTGDANIDGRSDIYSLGCVLFEMIAGKPPFTGPTANAVMASRFSSPTPSLAPVEHSTTPTIRKVLTTAMSLAPEARYQTAKAMMADLESARLPASVQAEAIATDLRGQSESAIRAEPEKSSSTPEPRDWRRWLLYAVVATVAAVFVSFALWKRQGSSKNGEPADARVASIGVLPFANQSGDKQMEYFTDGLTDELISALSHVNGLQVAGRASSFSIKGKNLDARQAAERLNVAYVIDAGVRSGGSRVRVTWQLMDGKTGRGLGSGDLDGEMRDVIALQDSMAKKIVAGLQPVMGLTQPSALPRHQTANYEAHDLYLKGHFYWNQRTAQSMRQGISYLKQAIDKDSSYALAWAELSSAYTLEPAFGDMRPAEVLQPARDAAKKAIELDPTLSEANTAFGMSLAFNDRDPRAATIYLDKAIALDPQNSFPHLFRVWPFMMLGQLDGALAELRKARELDPLSEIINTRLSTMLVYMGRYEEAAAELRKALGVDPSNVLARFELGRALAGAGKFDEAFREFPDAIDAEAGRSMSYVAWAEARAGRPEKARSILQRLQARSKERYITPDGLAGAAAAAGEISLALEYLDQGLRERSFYMQVIRFDPTYEVLRSQPRFQRILSQVERKYTVGPQSKR